MSLIIIRFVKHFQPHLINDNEFDFLIACTEKENKIKKYKFTKKKKKKN